MSDESENYEFSDGDIDETKHTKLVDDILSLNKIQTLKKPSRTEPTLQISEFNLVKSVTGNKGSVHLNELTKVLKGRKKQDIAKKVQSTSTKSKTLPKPLEKPQADRIRRSVNYEKSRLQLDRWEALVTSNRAASHIHFPLNSTEKLKIVEKEAEKYPGTWRLKSDLQKELEKIEPKIQEYHINTEDTETFPLTPEEIAEQRREAAKLRAHQSYKEAKARRQNKIKSKKYHRILRREKIKKKLKEFEELQKTNPEEALKKLDDIEKARAEERFSLRHKGTGQWAKNKQIRAKYDKESRQVLAQQLAISRELTQKVKPLGSDSDDEGIGSEENAKPSIDDTNPWVAGVQPDNEVSDFVKGYRVYWDEHNKKLQQSKNTEASEATKTIDQIKATEEATVEITKTSSNLKKGSSKNKKLLKKKKQDHKDVEIKETTEKVKQIEETEHETTKIDHVPVTKKSSKLKEGNRKNSKVLKTKQGSKDKKIENVEHVEGGGKETVEKEKTVTQIKKSTKLKKDDNKNSKTLKGKKLAAKSQKKNSQSTSEWDVSALDKIDNGCDVEDIFDKLEQKIGQKVKQKYSEIKESRLNKGSKAKIKKQTNKKKNKADLSMPSKSKKHIIDEQLIEESEENKRKSIENCDQNNDSNVNALKTILGIIEPEKKQVDKQSSDIDPNKFVEVKKTNLNTAIPDILMTDDNEENVNQRGLILEAFEDDDIAEDFAKEKADELDKDTPKDIDLNLPGWGSWAGTNINPSKRKRKRFIIKMPPKMPRKDDNKGTLIINEKAQSKIKPHMVSEVPFPFKTVKDYEASIRAPIGNTFVPETAFKKLIEPTVTSKMGAIIEPITKGILVGTKKA